MSILGIAKEQATQLLFRDDRSFLFRKLPVEHGFMLERIGEIVKSAWMMPYKLQKKFKGYKGSHPGMVLMSYGRDIVLDPFGQLADEEKPEQGPALIKKTIANIATGVVYRHSKEGKKTITDTMVLFLGGAMLFLLVIIAIAVLMKQRGGG